MRVTWNKTVFFFHLASKTQYEKKIGRKTCSFRWRTDKASYSYRSFCPIIIFFSFNDYSTSKLRRFLRSSHWEITESLFISLSLSLLSYVSLSLPPLLCLSLFLLLSFLLFSLSHTLSLTLSLRETFFCMQILSIGI